MRRKIRRGIFLGKRIIWENKDEEHVSHRAMKKVKSEMKHTRLLTFKDEICISHLIIQLSRILSK